MGQKCVSGGKSVQTPLPHRFNDVWGFGRCWERSLRTPNSKALKSVIQSLPQSPKCPRQVFARLGQETVAYRQP
eukprot:4971978-Amphidinium_carterae.1